MKIMCDHHLEIILGKDLNLTSGDKGQIHILFLTHFLNEEMQTHSHPHVLKVPFSIMSHFKSFLVIVVCHDSFQCLVKNILRPAPPAPAHPAPSPMSD